MAILQKIAHFFGKMVIKNQQIKKSKIVPQLNREMVF